MINYISVVANSLARSVDLNGVSEDAVNSSDDIHPQYKRGLYHLGPQFTLDVARDGGSNYTFSQYLTLEANLVQKIDGGVVASPGLVVGLSGVSQLIGCNNQIITGSFLSNKMSITYSANKSGNNGTFIGKVLTYQNGVLVDSLSFSDTITTIGPSWQSISHTALDITEFTEGDIMEIYAGIILNTLNAGTSELAVIKNLKVMLYS